MEGFKMIPIPAEDCDALGITADSILETHITEYGALVIRVVTNNDLNDFVCDNDCESCPITEQESFYCLAGADQTPGAGETIRPGEGWEVLLGGNV